MYDVSMLMFDSQRNPMASAVGFFCKLRSS